MLAPGALPPPTPVAAAGAPGWHMAHALHWQRAQWAFLEDALQNARTARSWSRQRAWCCTWQAEGAAPAGRAASQKLQPGIGNACNEHPLTSTLQKPLHCATFESPVRPELHAASAVSAQ